MSDEQRIEYLDKDIQFYEDQMQHHYAAVAIYAKLKADAIIQKAELKKREKDGN